MADREDARPDFNPKHRIVGAIIIVALVVIVVPMILNERQPPSEIKDLSETPVRGETANTRMVVTPVAGEEPQAKPAGETAAKAVTPTPTPIAASTPKPEVKPVAPVERLAPVKKAPPVKKPQTVTTANITKGWIVQVGTFSNTGNAVRLREKLKTHGHTVHTETVMVAGKKAMRLRVGPFHDKEQAARALALIRQETGVLGSVQTYP